MHRKQVERWCEWGILFLTLAILTYGPLATGAVRTPDFLVIQGLTVGVLLLWTVRVWVDRRLEILWPPICWTVVAFALYALVRYLTADIEYVARQEWLRVLVYAFLFLAILNNLHGQEAGRLIAFAVIVLGTGISFYALYQFITGSDRVWWFVNPYKHRGTGTYINPNHLAGFLELIVPVSLAWALASRAKPVAKVLLGYTSLVMLAGITVTMSRGGWVATAVTLLVFFVILALRSTRRWVALGMLAVVVGGVLYLAPKSYYLQKRWELVAKDLVEARVADVRPAIWHAAIQLWKESPWWGVGPGHFDERFRAFRPAQVQNQPDRAHNDYLNTLVDWGVVGTALVVAAWALLYAGVARTWGYVRGSLSDLGGRSSNKFALVFGASLGLFAILLHSVTDFNMHIPANAILAVTWMALVSGHLRFATERYWFRGEIPTRVAATVILLGGAVYLSAEGWQRAREQLWLSRAAKLSELSPKRVEALERAFAIEPQNARTAYLIGETFRLQSFEGGDRYAELATNAMRWFAEATRLHPYDAYPPLRYGMCLDWLGRHAEAQPYFDRAAELDPNGYYVVAHVGWHYVQLGDYAAARPWFERSRKLMWKNNPMADSYLEIIRSRLLEAATNAPPAVVPPAPERP